MAGLCSGCGFGCQVTLFSMKSEKAIVFYPTNLQNGALLHSTKEEA